MAILGKIHGANNSKILKKIIFTWLRRNAVEIGVHREMTYEKAIELANRVGYQNSATLVRQAAINKSRQFPPYTSQSDGAKPVEKAI